METEHALTRWRALLRSVPTGGGTDEALTGALPVLRAVTGATSAMVLRRQEERWAIHLADGDVLATTGLAARLGAGDVEDGPCDPPTDWAGVGSAACRRLPGHLGWLVLAWVEHPEPWAEAATDLLVSGLARAEAEERYLDLRMRVDNAQQLANMGDYDWHIESDTNTWSDQLFRIYGHEPQAFNPSYERFLSFIHPDDQTWISELHQRAYATGEPYAMTERIVRPDGEVRYLSSNGQVVIGPEGRPVRMRGTCIDITDRVLAEQERQRGAVRFRNLVESSPDAILVMDTTGVVVEANGRAHELLGGDPVGRDLADLLPRDTERSDGAVDGCGVDGRALVLDVTMADLSHLEGEGGSEGEVAAFLHDALPRLRHETLTATVREAQLRRRQAMEINDNVVQGLSAALYALRDGDPDAAGSLVERTLNAARSMMSDLLEPRGGEIQPGDLVRSTPSRLGAPT